MKRKYLLSIIFSLAISISYSQSDNELKNNIETIFNDIIASIGNNNPLPPKLIISNRNPNKVAYLRGNSIYFELETAKLLSKFDEKSNDAIAYILGHEIAHHYLQHAWMRKVGSTYFSEDMKEFLSEEKSSFEQRKKEEMEADLHAGFFSRLAGYNSLEIAEETIELIYETYGINPNIAGYPSLEDRKNTIELKIDELKKLNAVFEVANLTLITGNYQTSQELFEHILYKNFTSREIYNNLAISYFLEGFTYTDNDVKKFIFPVIVEQNSRAKINASRDFNLSDDNKIALEKFGYALKYFETSFQLDYEFTKANFNSYCTKFIMNFIDPESFEFEEEELDKIKNIPVKYIYELKGLYYALNKKTSKAKKFLKMATCEGSKSAKINLEHFENKESGIEETISRFSNEEVFSLEGNDRIKETIDSFDISRALFYGLEEPREYIPANGNKIYIKELDNSKVYQINNSTIIQTTKYNNNLVTKKGIKIHDSSLEDITKKYGDSYNVYSFFDSNFLVYTKYNTIFEIKNDKLIRLAVYASNN